MDVLLKPIFQSEDVSITRDRTTFGSDTFRNAEIRRVYVKNRKRGLAYGVFGIAFGVYFAFKALLWLSINPFIAIPVIVGLLLVVGYQAAARQDAKESTLVVALKDGREVTYSGSLAAIRKVEKIIAEARTLSSPER